MNGYVLVLTTGLILIALLLAVFVSVVNLYALLLISAGRPIGILRNRRLSRGVLPGGRITTARSCGLCERTFHPQLAMTLRNKVVPPPSNTVPRRSMPPKGRLDWLIRTSRRLRYEDQP